MFDVSDGSRDNYDMNGRVMNGGGESGGNDHVKWWW